MPSDQMAGVRLPEMSVAKRALLEARLRGRHRPSDTIARRAGGGPAPLSFAQERLWFLDRLAPGSTAYNVPLALRLQGPLDAAVLERALGETVRRHEALRTTFREVDGAPVQVAAPAAGFALPVGDLSGLPEARREAEARRRIAEEALRPFDLAAGPLFRAGLLRLGAGEHVLLLCMHHIVSDGWSMEVLFREAAALYAAFREGRGSPLPEPELQYADYAAWQRERLRGEALDRHLAWWRERLAALPEPLELPADGPRRHAPSSRAGTVRLEAPAGLAERLEALGRREGATPFVVLLGAFQLLLAKYSGSEDVVVGTPVAGRERGEVQELVGFFANTLVLRVDLSGDPAFRETLRRVREGVMGAYEHQELPFERLVAELQPDRAAGDSPLFRVMFSLQDARRHAGAIPGLAVRGVDAELGAAKFDLSLLLAASPGALRGELSYRADLFERATVERMAGHFARVLEQVADDPDVPLSRVELMDAAERAPVVEEWSRTDAEYPSDRTIHGLFEEQAERAPGAVALVSGGGTLSYGQLNARANRLARHLRGLGVAPETRVGICLERGPEMVVSILGVLKAGGAYVPLDPGYPAERLAFMLEDSGARVLLTQESLRAELPVRDGTRVLSIDAAGDGADAESRSSSESDVGAGGLAYVMYTSGSTGTPKGVGVEHRGVVRLARGADYVELGPDEVVLQGAPVSFDASTLEIWGALLNGARLVLMPGGAPSLEELGRAVREHGVTTLWLTAGLFAAMVEERLEDLAGVRQLLAGGDVLPPEAVRRVRERFPACRLVNGYGPTENTVFTCCHVVPPEWGGGPVPIGRPIAGTRAYVLDAWLAPVPAGVPGELFAGGDGVARGYLGRPELTAGKFVPDPFGGRPGARLYRTGDRARRLPDGTLEYLGRVDQQVKIRGFRIEPGEIEAALRALPGVRECAVVAREDASGERRLVAYVAGDADAGGLRAHLRGALPEHMVPSAFVLLDALPLTRNGKLDRAALPAPDYAQAERAHVAPRTPAEELLAGIWADVLGLERVGAEDGFFDLGGHSLLATRVVSRVRETLGVEVPLRALFEGPTVAEMAARVEAMRREGRPGLPPVVPVPRDRPLPLSFAQERLWFLDRLEPGSTAYNISLALRLVGPLDAAALEAALAEVVRRHEALRTTFPETESGPVQAIAPFAGLALPVEELAGLPAAEREAEVRRIVAAELAAPYDLAAGPLFRARLLRLGSEEHVLLPGMHHVVSDGWSMGVLFREVAALYAALREGRPSPLPELPVQYADFAVWQRERLEGEALEGQLAWWRERLDGAPELLELPTDRPRPAAPSHRGATVPVELPRALDGRLRALARAERATPFMLLLAAFQLLLARHAGQDDVVVGTPVAGRSRAETEGLIGFFVNTLALRTDLSGDPPFRRLLARVRRGVLGAHEHADIPFERLVAELQPERRMSRSPIFQAMLALQNDEDLGTLPGLEVRSLEVEAGTAKFDLSLGISVGPGGLRGALNYATDLFERATAERMAGHFARVLEQLVDDPDAPLSAVELMGPAERARVLDEWNRTAAPFPSDLTIHGLVEAQVERTPGAVAVVFEDRELTYRELDDRANRLAARLRALGVGPETRVGLCMERSPEMVVALLAVLKAGGAYVPLDPGYPADRVAYMLADSAVPVLLTQERLASALPATDAAVLVVNGSTEYEVRSTLHTVGQGDGGSSSADEVSLRTSYSVLRTSSPETLAYVIYTSGSTGRPKGVMNQHRGVVNRLAWMQAQYGIGAGDVVLQKTPFSFDVSVWEFFWPLKQGARLVMARPDGHRDPAYLQETIERHGVTTLHFVPSMLQQFVETADPARCGSLRRVVCSGEALPAALVERFHERFPPPVELHNLYGPTEAAVDVSWWACGREGPVHAVPIGRPVWNTRLYVLDPGLRPVPVGVQGELYIGGVQVARGYLGRPELTAEKFVPDPFSGEAGARLYRTGDRARRRTDGALEYLGRLDAQVKVRGFRIEPGEVEAALRRAPGVADCAVVPSDDGRGDTRLVAYVVGTADAEGLRGELRRGLPEFMVPAAWVFLEALPLSPNGKLDRKVLPAPEYAAAAAGYVAPRTPAEEVLAGIWADVLRVERVGVEDGFFELGGHSLLATRVVSRVREALGVELPLRAVFEAPTVAALAGRVDELRREGRPQLPPVVPALRNRPLPLSFAQERLWFLDRLQPGSTVYNVPAALRLSGALDVQAVRRALGEVVRRHEALRTTFAVAGGAPVQVVAPFAGFAVPVEDLSGLPEEGREAEMRRRVTEEAARPFDLAAGPLFRALLLRLGAAEHVLVVCMHHVVSDGWSLEVLFREVAELYAAFREGRPSPLTGLPVQYADFAVWQRERLEGEVLDGQLAWWRDRLAGAPELLELPTDRPRPAAPSQRGATVPVELPAPLLDALQAVARGEGATLFMTVLGAFQLLLSRYAGSDDVVVGSPVAGRTRRETEGLIGFFVNTLVLRADLSGDPAFRGLLRRVREATLGAYEHQDLPFERLVGELRPERSLSHSPLFQVSFTLGTSAPPAAGLPGIAVGAADAETGTAKFDLSLGLEATPRGLAGGLVYATDLFDRATVERMAGHLGRVLEQVARDPGVPLSRLELMGAAERAAVLAEGRVRARFPAEECIHQRFAARAAETPHAVAVSCGGESLTYAELDRRSAGLARALRRRGVGPETRVGLCLERSAEMVVAILGVLRAGGAYVPVDPAYPADRIAYLLADSGVALVLAQEGTRGVVAESPVEVVMTDGSTEYEVRSTLHTAGQPDGGSSSEDEVSLRTPHSVLRTSFPDSAAYVIYTSGSTGRPKGVVVSHANVLRLLDATQGWFGFGADDVWTLFHSYAFDFSVWEIWGALLYGGRLVVVPFTTSRDPAEFRALLGREGVTVLNQTPSAFRQLARADESAADGDLALRWVVFGGEALEPRALKPWFDRHGDARPRLVNMYGITETTVHVTWRPVSAEDAESAPGSMVGEAIPDLGLHLLDAALEPVPTGVPGEMFVGGAGVARGYLGRPELTAERFVPDPFSGVPGARLYRSGDRARRRPGGDAEYLGRGDQQVKVRGFRIEPGEIEAALLAEPGVREAVVLVREDEPGARRLAAYVVADGGDDGPTAASLRAGLAARLPEYMVPAAFVLLDALPLTAHGKVDRRALPAPEGTRSAAADAFVVPAGPVEEALAAAWAETLGVERVGARDNFFALGGDSMRAIQLLARARERGVPFSLQDLFRHQTVAGLAAHAGPAGGGDAAAAAGPFSLLAEADRERVPAGVEDAYPATQLQLGMLFHSESRPGEAVYHNVQAFTVRAPFDGARLRGALAGLAQRHPVLRTSFDLAGFAEPLQLVHRRVEVPLAVTSLAHLDPAAQDAALDAWLDAERTRPFDWSAPPLIRFHVHVLGPGAFQFGFTEHHAILDGWSVATLQAELFAAYSGPGDAAAADAPPPSVLRDFVALEREVLASAEARDFWARELDDSVPTLPASRGAAEGRGSRSRSAALPPAVADALAEVARREGLPLKALLLAAHLRVLAATAGTDDVVTGLVVNGRPEGAGAERALGLFLNTVPLRVRLSGGTWLELAHIVFGAERALLPFRRFPVAELQRMRGGEAPFAALFNFVHFHVMDRAVAEGAGRFGGARGAGGTNFPFAAAFEAAPAGLQLSLQYAPARYTDAEADVVFGRYAAALEAIAGDPHGRYDAADLLSAAERELVLGGWSASAAAPPAETPVHARVAAQARRTPGATAVACGAESLSYAELDAAAGRLARFLAARGVHPGTCVGVCLERSPQLPVALLAVLRAGAAYVPLDPDYPDGRLSAMLADSGAPLLLTHSALAGRFGGWGGEVVSLDRERGRIAAGGADLPGAEADPGSLAYVIFTSGSTGRPKGVAVPHRALASHMAWMQRAFPLAPDDRVLQKTPVSFDASVWEFWAPLLAGATLVVAPPGAHRDAAELLRTVQRERVTVLQLVPSLLRALLDEPGAARLGRLRRLFCGGEALPAEVAGRARALGVEEVVNLYGPTEVCIDSVTHVFAGEAGATVPIGRPVHGVRAYVLDAAGTPVGEGVPGELYLGGAQLARGYLGRPELTAERFVPDPFGGEPGARLYRTGDRVRWLADGTLEYLGRTDAQVKVRGSRVEPGEIEAVLELHPALRDAAVAVHEDAAGERRLVAYVVPASGAAPPGAAELRAHLRARLAEAMVPAAFVPLDALPLTPSGKLDRRALPAPPAARGEEVRVAPRDALELRLAAVWEEVLGVAPVGVRDDFFALGGHSLLALRLLATVERTLGRRLPLAALLAGRTVERMARALRGGAALPAPGPLVPVQPGGGARPLFVVHAAGGGAASYAALARRLGPDQPLYALQARGLEGEAGPHARIEDMAADYLAQLRAVQPEGPYRLGGWSMGGVVAFEMARRLEAAGEPVELLALVDSRAPSGGAPAPDPDDPRVLAGFMLHLGLAPERIAAAAGEVAALPPAERLRRALEAAREADLVPDGLEPSRFEALWSVFRANVAAAAAYRPGPASSDLLLVLAEDRAAPDAVDEGGWRALTTGTVRTTEVPGDHFSLVREPHVGGLAEVLSEALASTRGPLALPAP